MEQIMHGNCIDIMKKFPYNYIDLTVTSPPYDNLRDYNGYTFDFEGIANQLYRITKDGGVVVWIVGDATVRGSETGTSFKQALYFKKIGFNLHDTMIYQKDTQPCHDPRNRRYKQYFEYMFVLSKGKPKTYNEICDVPTKYAGMVLKNKTKRKPCGGMRHFTEEGREVKIKDNMARSNIWKYSTDKRVMGHPAIYPEKLAEDHILTWSTEGDIVLDPMCGSGTTCKMAMVNNRNYIGIDISEEYCNIARKRIAEHEQQLKIF